MLQCVAIGGVVRQFARKEDARAEEAVPSVVVQCVAVCCNVLQCVAIAVCVALNASSRARKMHEQKR